MRSGILLLFILLAVTNVQTVEADTSGRERVRADVEACWKDPRFGSIGGSMIGDCLFERAQVVEADIELLMREQTEAYCQPHDRELFNAAQSQWAAYRDAWCDMVEASPGNTPAYVNAMACRLNLARDRHEQLKFLEAVGEPRCP